MHLAEPTRRAGAPAYYGRQEWLPHLPSMIAARHFVVSPYRLWLTVGAGPSNIDMASEVTWLGANCRGESCNRPAGLFFWGRQRFLGRWSCVLCTFVD